MNFYWLYSVHAQWVSTEDLCVILLGKGALNDHMPNKVMDSLKLVVNSMHMQSCCRESVERNTLEVVVQDSNKYPNNNYGSLLQLGVTLDQSGPKHLLEGKEQAETKMGTTEAVNSGLAAGNGNEAIELGELTEVDVH